MNLNLKKYKSGALSFLALLSAPRVFAVETFDIGTAAGDLSIFDNVISFMQNIVNFVGGPMMLALSFIALVGFILAWMYAPSGGALGGLFRVVIGVAMLASAALFLTALFG